MRTYKTKKTKVLDQIVCDVCGCSCTITEPVIEYEYAKIEARWGYFSLQDGMKYDIEMCEECFNEVLSFLKHKRKQHHDPFIYPTGSDPLDGKSYFP